MPSDFSIHSDLLVHWTGKDIDAVHQPPWYEQDCTQIPEAIDHAYIRRLRDILNVGFWMTKQDSLCLQGGVDAPAADCLCFTELKLSQSRTHAAKYGYLGIAVKRPFLFGRGGRPVVYFQPRGLDVFLNNCSTDLTDKRLLQFFKPMHPREGHRMKYDLYDESEWRILKYWLDLDTTNLTRIATRTLNFVMPQGYETNSIKWSRRTATRVYGKKYCNVTETDLRSCFDNVHPSLLWLARALMATGDPVGAALTAMLMRHWNSEDISLFDTAARLSQMAGIPDIPQPPGGVSLDNGAPKT